MVGLWLSDYWPVEGRATGDGGRRGVARLEQGGMKKTSQNPYLDWTYSNTWHPVFLAKYFSVYCDCTTSSPQALP